jgi:hypothetical protein
MPLEGTISRLSRNEEHVKKLLRNGGEGEDEEFMI